MSRKNIFEFSSLLITLAALCAGLAGCGGVQPLPTPTNAPTYTSIPSIPTALPTEMLSPTPTEIPLFQLEGLRMAYIVDGDLYLQDSGKQPIQLTDSGEDHTPIFSDDGEKITFFRGVLPRNLYSINADGSQEQALVTSSMLNALGFGYSNFAEPRSLAFVPGTHQLLFNTHELDSLYIKTKSILYWYDSKPYLDLLIVDTDSSEIKRLLAPGQGGPFIVSPDGKTIAIQARDHVDVIGLDGKVIKQNLITYPSEWLYLWEPEINWGQDSNRLNVVLPIPTAGALDYTGPEPRTILEYSANSNSVAEINFSPPPMDDFFSVSMDGNWIAYNFADTAGKTNETAIAGIYLGNLHDGNSHWIDVSGLGLNDLPRSFYWSSDSMHFIFMDGSIAKMFLGDIHGATTLIAQGEFLGWFDDGSYLYTTKGKIFLGEIGKEGSIGVIQLPAVIDSSYFTFVNLKSEMNK
ncbi:MAG: TolB family protein [Chloroflexota bacterium]